MEKRKGRKLVSLIVTSLLIVSTALCFVAVIQAAMSRKATIFGYRIFYVTTGSMDPTIPPGAVVLVHRSREAYETGNIITFVSRDSAIYGKPNTHRIVGVQDDGGLISYTTKGDANAFPDPVTVSADDVIGRVVWHTGSIRAFGALVSILGTRLGFVVLVLLPLLAVTAVCIRDFSREYRKELKRIEEEMRGGEHGKDRTDAER